MFLTIAEGGGGGTPMIDAASWKSVMDAITAQVNVANVVAVLAVLATASIGLVFMWWGVRKMCRVLMAAFRKGKISI